MFTHLRFVNVDHVKREGESNHKHKQQENDLENNTEKIHIINLREGCILIGSASLSSSQYKPIRKHENASHQITMLEHSIGLCSEFQFHSGIRNISQNLVMWLN
jgi:hypothetical protein